MGGLFSSSFYNTKLNEQIQEINKKLGIELQQNESFYYFHKSRNWKKQELIETFFDLIKLKYISQERLVSDGKRRASPYLYFKGRKQIEKIYKNLPQYQVLRNQQRQREQRMTRFGSNSNLRQRRRQKQIMKN